MLYTYKNYISHHTILIN